MRAAIIGLGVIGKVHYEVLRKRGEEIVALCDIDPQKLTPYEGVKQYADYKKMLDEETIDVVHICTPHYLHAEMVVYALKKDKNVLCEKPLCIKEEEINEILAAERASKWQLGVCFQNRFNRSSSFIKEYLRDKKIDRAEGVVAWHRDETYYRSAEWRGKKSTEGGGVLINQAIHTLDLLQWIAGMPAEVAATADHRALKKVIEVEDTVDAHFFGDVDFDLHATVTSNVDHPVDLRFSCGAQKIVVYPDRVTIDGRPVDIDAPDQTKWYGKPVYGDGHQKLISVFYECVSEGRRFPIDGSEGAKSVRCVLAAYRSGGERTKIR